MNIYAFSPGQVITRTERVYAKQPARYNSTLGIQIEQEPVANFTFVGQPCQFLGIANGGINLKVGSEAYMLPLHADYQADWSEGWQEYVDLGVSEKKPIPKESRSLFFDIHVWLFIAAASVIAGQFYIPLGLIGALICVVLGLQTISNGQLGERFNLRKSV